MVVQKYELEMNGVKEFGLSKEESTSPGMVFHMWQVGPDCDQLLSTIKVPLE